MHIRLITSRLLERTAAVTAVALMLNVGPLSQLLADTGAQVPEITPSFADGRALSPRDTLEFKVNRPLLPSDGKIGVFIGRTDVSSLLIHSSSGFAYTPSIVPLPAGESQVLVYLISPDNLSKQIAQFSLRIEPSRSGGAVPDKNADPAAEGTATASAGASSAPKPGSRWRGFDKATATPSITLGMKSQAAESHFPDTNGPPRPMFADMTLQGSIRTDLARGAFNSQAQFDVVGSSFKQEALRFGSERDTAPNIDLASYLMQFQIGKGKVTVGHLAFGSNRQLINNFSSRGISFTTPVTKYADVTLAAMNGTSIVGWSNFFGLSRSKHQFVTGAAGFEFIPERRGGLRFEVSILDGRLLPVSGFNQGSITDAERSRGIGFQLIGSDKSQRWRFDGGFARSRFTNPADPLLFQNFNVVPAREETRNARYFDGVFNILQNVRLSDTKRATVTVNYKHEQVDPLFKSVAAFIQSDRSQNQIDVVAAIGDLTATVTHLRFNDNLGNVPSVLKSLSRRTGLILGTPLSSLLGSPNKPSPWLPRVSYSLDEVHQLAASIPVNGGFEASPSTVPDQVSTNQNLSAEWQVKQVRWGYRFNRSFQDNRQVGRELADLRTITNVWNLGLQPSTKLNINLDVGWDSAVNKEMNRTDHTFRVGPNFNWNLTNSMVLAGSLSATRIANVGGTSRNRSAELDLQWSYRLGVDKGRHKKVQAQFFVRYSDRYAYARDSLFGFRNLTKLQTLNTGVNFTFF